MSPNFLTMIEFISPFCCGSPNPTRSPFHRRAHRVGGGALAMMLALLAISLGRADGSTGRVGGTSEGGGHPAVAGAAAELPWVVSGEGLTLDPAVTSGVLPNGLAWAVMPNAEPPGRVSLRLLVRAGSLQERDDQAGLAHFLEHMAFNGSKHYPPGALIEVLQRFGMGFGADTNAHTSFNETVYKLELPANSAEMLSEGLRVLRDYADGLLLLPQEIDDERGVILAEKRAGDTIAYRTQLETWRTLLPESLLPRRFPIGETEVIQSAQRDRFEHYYQTWYRPSLAAVVVVGDLEPDAAAHAVETFFGDWVESQTPVPTLELGPINPRSFQVKVHPEREAAATDLAFYVARQFQRGPDSAARRVQRLREGMANSILNRRFERLAKAEGSPIASGYATAWDYLDYLDLAAVQVTALPGQEADATRLLEQTWRAAIELGFQEAELAEVAANRLRAARQDVQSAATRRSRELSSALTASLSSGEVFTSREADLALVEAAIANFTAAEATELFRQLWGEAEPVLWVTGPLTEDTLAEVDDPASGPTPDETGATDGSDSKADLNAGRVETESADNHSAIQSVSALLERRFNAVYRASQALPVMAPEEILGDDWGYHSIGAITGVQQPATVVSDTHHESLGIRQIALSNGARLNLKPTDFEANTVRVQVRVGDGRLSQESHQEGLERVAAATLITGGLGRHDWETVRRLLAAENVSVGFSVGDDAFLFSGQCATEDFTRQLQLIAAYLVDPAFREEALRPFHGSLEQTYRSLQRTPEGVNADRVARFLAQGHWHFGYPAQDWLRAWTMGDVQAWLTPQFQEGYLEISVVGAIDPETVVTAFTEVFGCLPPRQAASLVAPAPAGPRVALPTGVDVAEFLVESRIPKGRVSVLWPTADMPSDIQRSRRLNLLSRMIGDRLRVTVREELGEGYSPYAYHVASEFYPDYGYLMLGNVAEPAKLRANAELLAKVGLSALSEPFTEDELRRSLDPLLTFLTEYQRDNGYWLGRVLSGSQARPEQLHWAETLAPDYAAITLSEVQTLAETYLRATRPLHLLITPAASE